MQLTSQQLDTMLNKPLEQAPVKILWLEGKEHLLVQEARDKILKWAKNTIEHRQLHQIEAQFDWSGLIGENASFGLFDEAKVYDLRFLKPTLKAADCDQVTQLSQVLDDQKFVVISSDKLDKKLTNTKAFKNLAQWMGVVTFWPLPNAQYPRWITQYSKKRALQLSPEATHWLASQHEGNLLALKQCLDRIQYTTTGSQMLEIEHIQDSTIFQSQYTSFDIVDFALAGQELKTLKGLQQLKHQGEEPILILWAINNALEAISAAQKARQANQQQVPWPKFKIFGPRISLFEKAARRITPAQRLEGLECAGRIDAMVKGLIKFDPWIALAHLFTLVANPNSSSLTLLQSQAFEEFCE